MSRRPNPNSNPTAQPRPVPAAPAGLGAEGMAAWNWVWSPEHTWITKRHLGLAERYCRVRDVLALTFAQIQEEGISVTGSQKQTRSNPLLPQVKNLSTELRLCEIELGLTPASESKTTAPSTPAPTVAAPRTAKPVDASIVTMLDDHRRRNA
ncbi:P27 family phage terminase small subunit [Mycobacterium colombiense]